MEGATVGLVNIKSFSKHYGLGKQDAAHGGMVGSNFGPFRVEFRSSGSNRERVSKTSVDKILGNWCRKSERAGLVNASLSDTRPRSRASVAVLMEVEGVIADVHRYGHRQAFNLAFQELGLDCAQWTEAIFADLTRSAGGVEERMLTSYFTRVGWPTALPTSEQGAFIRNVLRVKSRALATLAESKSIPLRPDLEKFVDEVLESEVPLIVLAAYYKGGEQTARLLVDKLGGDRATKIKFVGEADVENSAYGQLVFGEGTSSSLDEQLAVAASRAVAAEKQRIAEEVASLLQLSVEIDTSSTQVSKKSIATLRAGAEIADMDVNRCILLASGLLGSQAALKIGMPCVVVRSSLTARAEFPAAKASLDGYGPGTTTLPRLLNFL